MAVSTGKSFASRFGVHIAVLVFVVSFAVGVYVLFFDQVFQRIISVLQGSFGS